MPAGCAKLLGVGLIIVFHAARVFAQAPDTLWTQRIGGAASDGLYAIVEGVDYGYLAVGHTKSFGSGGSDLYVVKVGVDGDTAWTRAVGGPEDDHGYSADVVPAGGYLVSGSTEPCYPCWADVLLLRLDADGHTAWTKTYGGSGDDVGYSVKTTPDGGCIIAGHTNSLGSGGYDVYLVKTDAAGGVVWSRTIGGIGFDEGRSVENCHGDDGYIIAGATSSYGAGGYDVYLVRTDAEGDTLWTRTYGGENADRAYSVCRTSDGGYAIAGYTGSFGVGASDIYLLKTDANGDTVWTRTYGGPDYELGYCVRETIDGGYVIAGYTDSFGAGGRDLYLVRANGAGDTLWTKTLGFAGDDQGRAVLQASDRGLVLAGDVSSSPGYPSDAYLVKTTPDLGGIGSHHAAGLISLRLVGPIPFRHAAYIEYALLESADVRISICNVLGVEIAALVAPPGLPGIHKLVWDGRDQQGGSVSAGVYFVQLAACGTAKSAKIVLVR